MMVIVDDTNTETYIYTYVYAYSYTYAFSWSERGTVNLEVVGSIPTQNQKSRNQIYNIDPQARVLNHCFT